MQIPEIKLAKNKIYYPILIVVSIIALCGIVYELLISTAASYLLGDSITQFSIVIGIYMSSMGLGAYLSKFFNEKLFDKFIIIEIILSLIGGSSIIIIFLFFSAGGVYPFLILYFLTVVIGVLVGLEIPIVVRLMEKMLDLKDNVASVLAFDYIGGLIGSVAFPLLFLPTFGIIRTAILMGLLNILSAIWLLFKTSKYYKMPKMLVTSIICVIVLLFLFLKASPISDYLEQNLYKDQIIISKQTLFQKIVVTKHKNDVRLFIDGNLQFSSIDEYRYHDGLIHVPANLVPHLENVLMIGGGDGLAARELLKYPLIKKITIVDLDKALVDLFKSDPILTKLNQDSLNNPKVNVINTDGLNFIKDDSNIYDLVVIDLPDPRSPALSKLYNKEFYQLIKGRMSRTGIMVTQATSPFFAKNAFWCIAKTVNSAFPFSNQYHVNVLSFGDWGFVLGSNIPISEKRLNDIKITVPTRFLTNSMVQGLFIFPKDSSMPDDIKINTTFSPTIVQYYSKGWEY